MILRKLSRKIDHTFGATCLSRSGLASWPMMISELLRSDHLPPDLRKPLLELTATLGSA